MSGAPPDAQIDRAISWAETILYALVSVVLLGAALVALVEAGHGLVTETDDGVRVAMEHTLDSLLIVFILVELLGAVRATIAERKLVAEPFLLVGIIASIKEIVVKSVFIKEDADIGDTMIEIGVLGAVVLALCIGSLLLRRKEREPEE